jgi:hypothetical protein
VAARVVAWRRSGGAGGLADLLTSGGGVEPASITSNVSGLTSMADMLSGGGALLARRRAARGAT